MGFYRGRKSMQNALNLLRSNSGENALQQPAVGTPMYKYWELVTGKRKIDRTRTAESKPKEFLVAKLRPFAVKIDSTAEAAYPIRFSKRSADVVGTYTSLAALNHLTANTIAIRSRRRGYSAAKINIFNPGTGVTNVTASNNQVTGRAYTRKNGNSNTYPFGTNNVTTNQKTENEVREELFNSVITKMPDATISFTPEIWK